MLDNKTPKQVEQELQRLLEQYKLTDKLSVADFKDWIYNSQNSNTMKDVNLYQKKFLKYFTRVKDIDKLNQILQVFMDAWNYFPHQALKGKSPQQMVESLYNNRKQPVIPDKKKMPKMIVGGQEMSWDDYWAMIKEMEYQQIPFKNWTEKDLLPKYKKFLNQQYQKDTVNKHYEVADIFFERALHVGFLTLEEIRKDFIQKEFPHWWQTHVLMNSLKEQEILFSLERMFEFIELVYKINKEKFGF